MRARFAGFVLDTAERALTRGQAQVPLEPKVFECLALLLARPGKLASMDELRARLWPDAHVTDGALRRIVNDLRRALGDTGSTQAIIRTRKRLGYVFVAPVAVDAGPPVSDAVDPARTWPFVGRDRELAALRGWLERAPGGLCFLSGEAGAGKSSLLARLQAQYAGRGRWLSGPCQASLGSPALWPFREVARQLLQAPELRAQALSIARKSRALRSIPELNELAAEEPPTPDARWAGFELCEAFAGMLRTLSRARPLVIAIEDIHWADEGSLALLETIGRAARDHALFVLASYRPEAVAAGEALSQVIGRTSGREGTFSVHLEALSLTALEALLLEVHYPGPDPIAAHALRELTGGNALLVHELLRHALATASQFDTSLPPSLSHIVGQRIDLLPAATQRHLSFGAVLGSEFSVELLSACVRAATQASLLAELEPALRSGVLQAVSERPDRLRFGHALVADVLAARLSLQERQAHHCSALRALQSLPAGAANSSALALHAFEAGGRVEAAERLQLCERAGREAFDALVFDRAALQLGRAVQLLPVEARSVAAAELTLLWAKARWYADGSEDEVERAYCQAAEYARRANSPLLLAEAAIGYAVGDESVVDLRTASVRPQALALADEAWAWLLREANGDVSSLVGEVPYRLAAARCWMRCEAGELSEHVRAARLALELAPPNPDAGRSLWMLALRSSAGLDPSDALRSELWQRVRAPELDLRQRVEALILTMCRRLMHGDLAGYERAASELSGLTELLPQPGVGRVGQRLTAYVATALCTGITTALIRGELASASERFAAVVGEFERRGLSATRRGDDNSLYMLSQLRGYHGTSSRLEPLVDKALKANPGEYWLAASFKVQFALERGELDAARAHYGVLRASGFVPQLNGRSILTKPETLVRLADACNELGDATDAEILYRALLPRAPYCIHDGALISWGACARPLGELAFQLGDVGSAEQHLEAALALNARFGHRPEHVRTQLALARVSIETGRAAEARTRIAEARAEAVLLGMRPMVALADRLGEHY